MDLFPRLLDGEKVRGRRGPEEKDRNIVRRNTRREHPPVREDLFQTVRDKDRKGFRGKDLDQGSVVGTGEYVRGIAFGEVDRVETGIGRNSMTDPDQRIVIVSPRQNGKNRTL
jgi:hypothetical protein